MYILEDIIKELEQDKYYSDGYYHIKIGDIKAQLYRDDINELKDAAGLYRSVKRIIDFLNKER